MKDRSEGVESSMARNVSKSIPGERQVLLPALVCVCVCVCLVGEIHWKALSITVWLYSGCRQAIARCSAWYFKN